MFSPEVINPADYPIQSDKVIGLSRAIVVGTFKGIGHLAHTIRHPLDSVVYPISDLVYDATIISSAHYSPSLSYLIPGGADLSGFAVIKKMIETNPQLYQDSVNRMSSRIEHGKKALTEFSQASIEKQVEQLSSGLTTVWVPGQILTGIKYLKNIRDFGTATPPKFSNLIESDASTNLPKVHRYSINEVRSIKGNRTLLYVYTADKELLLCNPRLSKPIRVPGPQPGETMLSHYIIHPELAQLKPVYAAGEVVIRNGKIIKIDNKSGHYFPEGDHLRITVENAFKSAGYKEVIGKYNPVDQLPHWKLDPIITVDQLRAGLGVPTVAVGVGVVKNLGSPKSDIHPTTINLMDGYPGFGSSESDLDLSTPDTKVGKSIFELDEETVDEFKTRAQAAQVAQVKLTELFRTEPQVDFRTKLLDIAEPLYQFGMLGSNISQLALMTGGHPRTWRGVGEASQGALSLASGLTSIATAKSLMSLTAVTGYVGVAVGALGLARSLFGSEDDNNELMAGMAQIHSAVIQVYSAIQDLHREMTEGFHRLEEILVTSVLTRLNQINSKLNRLERITTQSFKELHSKELIDIVDAIKKEICGEHTLLDSEKRDYLRRLSSWIDHHSKAQIQTSLIRRAGTTIDLINILGDESDSNILLSLILSELINLIPDLGSALPPIDEIPNLEILFVAVDVYLVASQRPGYNQTGVALITRAKESIGKVRKVIEILQDFKVFGQITIPDLLFRQYDYYRLSIGNLISKIRGSDNWSNDSTPLNNRLPAGPNRETLLELLNELEYRRLLLFRLNNIMTVDSLSRLESRSLILSRPVKDYIHNPEIYNYSKKGEIINFRRALEMGSSPNTWDNWGMPIHYVTKWTSKESKTILHLLFKYPDIQMSGGTKCDMGDTWGTGSNPILHSMNNGQFAHGILFCANGFDIVDSDGRGVPHGFAHFNSSHMGNSYWWVENGSITSIINTRMVKQLNNPDSRINKASLREAYKYYKQVEAGLTGKEIDDKSKVRWECLLLLTCVLNDLYPFQVYSRTQPVTPNLLNTPITGVGITYLMLAAAGGSLETVKYLERLGANPRITSDLKLSTSHHCFSLAVVCGAWRVADYYLATVNGVTNDQRTQITNGLRELPRNNSDLVDQPIVNKKIIRTLATMEERISQYLEKSRGSAGQLLDNNQIERCKIFALLITNIVNGLFPEHKLYNSLIRGLGDLQTGLKNGQIKEIANAFNLLDAILRTVRAPGFNYDLGPKVDRLLDELKV